MKEKINKGQKFIIEKLEKGFTVCGWADYTPSGDRKFKMFIFKGEDKFEQVKRKDVDDLVDKEILMIDKKTPFGDFILTPNYKNNL
jgi:hypothetical protein